MPRTNTVTAQAATRTAPNLNRKLILLGVFTAPSVTRALIQTDTPTTMMLHLGIPQSDLTLVETGDGWAMVQENGRIHRLVIA